MELVHISPMKITFPHSNNEWGLRPEPKETDNDWNDTLELLADIRENGMSDLFSVRPIGDDTYEVINGSRRAKVCQLLCQEGHADFQTIPVQVNPISEIDSLERQVAGNATVKSTNAKQYSAALAKIAVNRGYNADQLAKAVGKSVSFVYQMLKFNRLPDTIKELVAKDKMPVTNAIALTSLPKNLDPVDLLENACSMNVQDFSLKVAEAIDNYRNEQKALRTGKTPEFELTEKKINAEQMKANLVKAMNKVQDEPSEFNKGYLFAYQEIFQIDEVSAQTRKAAWEQKQKEKEAKAEQRKKDTETKKKESVAKYLKEHNITSLDQLIA